VVHTNVRPTENYYYDRSGRLVGVQDANAVLGSAGNINFHTNSRTLLAGTGYGGDEVSVLKEFHADGGIYERKYDVFGNMKKEINEIGQTETFYYDLMGRLTDQVHEVRPAGSPGNPGAVSSLTDTYTYDGLGRRITHTNSQLGSSVKELTDYDVQGRVVKMVDMGGNTTTYAYAWDGGIVTDLSGTSSDWTFGGWTTTTVNAAGLTATEKDDYFGRMVDKVDFGAHDYNFSFDRAGRMVSRSINGAGTITYGYYNTGLMSSATQGAMVSSYSYDVAGNRVYESYTAGSGWLQYAIVTWDAANRMTSFGDLSQVSGTPSITWEYDLGGNIRHMNSVYQQLDAQGNLTGTDVTQDYWYKYDSMNRFTTTKGSLVSGAITGGVSLTYDAAGRRATKTTGIFNGYYWEGEYASDGHTKIGRIAVTYNKIESYTYSTDGYLASVNFTYDFQGSAPLSDITYTMATYTRDAMGRVTAYSESAFDTVNDFGTTNTGVAAGVYTRTAVYNSKSQVTSDVATTIRSTGTWTASTTYDYKAESSAGSNVYTGAYQGGVVTHQATHTTFPGDYTNAETRNSYVWWDSALNNVTDYDAQSHTGALYPYHATYSYDSNGRLSSVGIVDGRSRTVSFVTDANGLILQRDENDANTTARAAPI